MIVIVIINTIVIAMLMTFIDLEQAKYKFTESTTNVKVLINKYLGLPLRLAPPYFNVKVTKEI